MTEDENTIGPYPLAWPVGRPRARVREAATFKTAAGSTAAYGAAYGYRRLTIAEGRDRVLDELDRFKALDVVISSNYTMDRREPTDPGAAVYFRLPNGAGAGAGLHCFACDKWHRLADNLAAIAAHIEALRGQLRWGVGDVAAAFAGYKALTAVGAHRPWWELLGVSNGATVDQIKARFRLLATQHHPDRGGNPHQMAEISAAYTEAMRERGASP